MVTCGEGSGFSKTDAAKEKKEGCGLTTDDGVLDEGIVQLLVRARRTSPRRRLQYLHLRTHVLDAHARGIHHREGPRGRPDAESNLRNTWIKT